MHKMWCFVAGESAYKDNLKLESAAHSEVETGEEEPKEKHKIESEPKQVMIM